MLILVYCLRVVLDLDCDLFWVGLLEVGFAYMALLILVVLSFFCWFGFDGL